MSFSNLLTLSYWTSQPFVAVGCVKWFWVLFLLLLVLAGIVIRLLRTYLSENLIKEILRRWGNLGINVGILGFSWFFFRQERIAFLAWRFWLLVWILIGVWWGINNLIYTIKRIPQIKEEKIKRELRDKYLPKKK